MANIVKQISTLYEQDLHSNVVKLCELAVTLCEQKPDFTLVMKHQLFVHYADSLYHLQQYIEAANAYVQVFQIRKFLLKAKNTLKTSDNQKELPSDVELKYRCHICFVKQKQIQKAVDVLQSIPARNRTVYINMALGNLYKETGMERSAITCYKEVLRENPHAIEAAENLLKLGVKGVEVNSLMLEATKELTWLNTWLRGHAQMHMKDYNNAVATFKSLDSLGLLKNNSQLFLNIAYCYNYMCDTRKTRHYLQRAICLTPSLKNGRDLLASLLYAANDRESIRELEKLANIETDVAHWTCEDWIVVGYLMLVHKRNDRAAYFGQQACNLNKRNIEGFLLKAESFMQMGKYHEAVQHCREVLQYTTNRYEAHKCLVECYIAMNRTREAVTMAAAACKQLNNSPQSLTLCASVLMRDPMTTCKVRSYLDRALNIDPGYSTAVYLLAEYLEESNADEACAVLKRHADAHPSSTAHQILADYLSRNQRDDEAFEHYNAALRLDSENQRAIEGLNNIGRSLSGSKLDSSYYVSAVGDTSTFNSQPQSQSDHDQDQESDTDPWPANPEFMPYE